MTDHTPPKQNMLGFWAALAAYAFWGSLVFYWKALSAITPYDIVAYRIFWSLVLLIPLAYFTKNFAEIYKSLKSLKTMWHVLLAATVLTINWLLYIWAVNNNRIVEASLGYFINPLISVLLGRIFLGEKMTTLQSLAIAIAACGVGYGVFAYGQLPWIGLCLASSFGLYGFFRKTESIGGISGLFLETVLLFPLAIIWIIWQEVHAPLGFFDYDIKLQLLLISTGFATTFPLLLFAYASRNISLASLGLLQYTAPTIKLLIGVFVYGEIVSTPLRITLGFVWVALALYSWCTISQWRTLPHKNH